MDHRIGNTELSIEEMKQVSGGAAALDLIPKFKIGDQVIFRNHPEYGVGVVVNVASSGMHFVCFVRFPEDRFITMSEVCFAPAK